jgi:hypothetical protein
MMTGFVRTSQTMSLTEFIEPADQEATITVLNPDSVQPVYRLLSGLFNEDVVTVQKTKTNENSVPSDTVLVEKRDESVVAVSSLDRIREELLFVNSDIYLTNSRNLDDVETPDVIRNLDEIPFTVTGYPESGKEKLLLIEISRHVEAMAWQADEGRLATGFQQLSRLDNESGTREVYERLGGEAGVDTHVYGVPDATPSIPGVTVHGADTQELRRSWFVVYESTHHPHEAAALVAIETDSNTWEGCWTYDPARVARILDYLDRNYSNASHGEF